jgi:hypothetical protein
MASQSTRRCDAYEVPSFAAGWAANHITTIQQLAQTRQPAAFDRIVEEAQAALDEIEHWRVAAAKATGYKNLRRRDA